MVTLILVCIHAFATNGDFQPLMLYFGTFLIDMSILETVCKVFGKKE